MPIIESRSDDIYRNLAAEELLLDRLDVFGPSLFLCRNRAAVVLGKNQNPWRECRVERLPAEGLALARRVSGGGAVYHDPGNLNYGFVCRRADYRAEVFFEIVIAALGRLGLAARLMKSTSLVVDGFKVSGNAFAFRGDAVLHHGTLLVSADLDRLRRVFDVDPAPIETHAIPSVPAPVANLSDLAPGVTADRVAEALRDEYRARFGADGALDENALPADALAALAGERQRAEWVYGRTPAFVTGRPRGWRLRVEEGVVRAWLPPTHAPADAPPPPFVAGLPGRRFEDVAGVWASYSAGTSST